MIDELLKNGVVPMITLHHFSNPVWFEEIGAFEYQNNIFWFEEFSEFIFKEYSSKVKFWCTFNEVMMYSNIGYIEGRFPPGKTNTVRFLIFNFLAIGINCCYKYVKCTYKSLSSFKISSKW